MSLPEDVMILKIFPRVKDVIALFRCAMACKRWCRLLVSDRAYLRRCLPEDACRSSPFAGVFTQQRSFFVPGPRPVLGHRRPLSSFVQGIGDFMVSLTSRHGLLLVRVRHSLFVCDLLAGTFRPLPELDIHWGSRDSFMGYAMLTAADCPSWEQNDEEFPLFKVMIVVVTKFPMHYDLYTYSSVGELGWSKFSGPGDAEVAGYNIYVTHLQNNAAVCHGDACWFFRGTSGSYILCASAKTGHVCTIRMMNTRLCNVLPPYDEPYLSVSADGKLAFLLLQTDGSRLDIYDGKELHIMLQPPAQHMNSLAGRGVEHTCLGEKNGMVIIKDNHQRIYVAHLKTGVMQEIQDWPRNHGLGRKEIVPLEMDWPALFISRLGVVARV